MEPRSASRCHVPWPTAPKNLRDIGALDALEHDPRPTFITSSESLHSQHHEGVPVYWNPALAIANSRCLLTSLLGLGTANEVCSDESSTDLLDFRDWVLAKSGTKDHYSFAGFVWTAVALRESHWTIVSGISSNRLATQCSRKLPRNPSKPTDPILDWTDDVAPLRLSSHVAWARSIDWAETSLGPMSLWSPQLRSFVNLVFMDPKPYVDSLLPCVHHTNANITNQSGSLLGSRLDHDLQRAVQRAVGQHPSVHGCERPRCSEKHLGGIFRASRSKEFAGRGRRENRLSRVGHSEWLP